MHRYSGVLIFMMCATHSFHSVSSWERIPARLLLQESMERCRESSTMSANCRKLQYFLESLETKSKDVDEAAEEVIAALEDKSKNLLLFSENLRSLFHDMPVTKNGDKEISQFFDLREITRYHGVLYLNQILPVTEEGMKAVSRYMDFFVELDYSDWSSSLQDILEELKDAEAICVFSKQLHNQIVTEMMENGDEADELVRNLNTLQKKYEQDVQYYKGKYSEYMKLSDYWKIAGPLGHHYKKKKANEAKEKLDEAHKRQANAEVAKTAADITSGKLIPAIRDFVEGLNTVIEFLKLTQDRIEKMIDYGETSDGKVYYHLMNKYGGKIRANADSFVTKTDIMKNNLKGVPKNQNDQKNGEHWLKARLDAFKVINPESYARIYKSKILRDLVEKLFPKSTV